MLFHKTHNKSPLLREIPFHFRYYRLRTQHLKLPQFHVNSPAATVELLPVPCIHQPDLKMKEDG